MCLRAGTAAPASLSGASYNLDGSSRENYKFIGHYEANAATCTSPLQPVLLLIFGGLVLAGKLG